jgi:hypothetical protein
MDEFVGKTLDKALEYSPKIFMQSAKINFSTG